MSSPLTTPSWQQATRRRTQVFVIAALILALLAGASVYFWLDGAMMAQYAGVFILSLG